MQLRGDKADAEEDMSSRCFICSLRSADFDRRGQGFNHHIEKV